MGLKWQDINFNDNTLHVERNLVVARKELIFKEPKNETSIRTLKIPLTLVAILRKHKKEQLKNKLLFGKEYVDYDLVICKDNGQPINPSSFSHKFGVFIKKNNLPHIRFHDLRHTNATIMLQSNIAPKIASSRLGHSSINVTMDIYTHVLSSMEEETADKLDKLIYNSNL